MRIAQCFFLCKIVMMAAFDDAGCDRLASAPCRNRKQFDRWVRKVIKDVTSPAIAHAFFPPPANHSRYPHRLSKLAYGTGLTMLSASDLSKLGEQLVDIVNRRVPGDIYEAGTWRGGTAIFMVLVLRKSSGTGLQVQYFQLYSRSVA